MPVDPECVIREDDEPHFTVKLFISIPDVLELIMISTVTIQNSTRSSFSRFPGRSVIDDMFIASLTFSQSMIGPCETSTRSSNLSSVIGFTSWLFSRSTTFRLVRVPLFSFTGSLKSSFFSRRRSDSAPSLIFSLSPLSASSGLLAARFSSSLSPWQELDYGNDGFTLCSSSASSLKL